MIPQLLFRVGWIVSIILLCCWAVWLIVDRCSQQKAFSAGHASPPRLPLSPASTLLISVVLFVGAFASRYWLSRFMFGPWYFADEAFDSCIMPYQLSRSEAIWGGGTNYLTYLIYLAAYRLFGFGVGVARAVNSGLFAGSAVIVFWALHGAFGARVSGVVLGMMLLSSSFITHSIYATAITFSFLPSSIILFILTKPLTDRSAALLGITLNASLYLFPAAFLTGVCLVFFHAVVFYRDYWTWRTRLIGLIACVLSGGLGYQMRLTLTGNPHWNQWAGGFLSFDQAIPSILVVLKDVFWESRSWNTLNLGMPYLDTAMAGFLMIGVGASLIPSKSCPPTRERRWVLISLLSFFGSVALSALAGAYPGVRRIFPSMLLLFFVAGLGLEQFWRRAMLRPALASAVIVCFGLVATRSYVVARESWPLSGQSDFMVAARETLLHRGNGRQEVVIIAYDSDQYLAQHYRCALSLDDTLNGRFHSVGVIRRAGLSQRPDLPTHFILFANELFSDRQLEDMFGSRPHSSTIRRPVTSPRPGVLAAIYEFSEDPLPQQKR